MENNAENILKEDIRYKWRVEFKVTPSFMIQETGSRYNFELRDEYATYVVVEYDTPEINERLESERRHNSDEYAEQTIAYEHQKAIEELMIQRMVYRKQAEKIEIEMTTKNPELINRQELVDNRLPVKHHPVSTLESTHTIWDLTDYLKEGSNFWNTGFQYITEHKTKEDLKKDMFRISEWLILAEKQNDDIQSFILTWIAFNGLYNLFSEITKYKSKDERDNFEHTINELLKVDEAKGIVNNPHNLLEPLKTLNDVRSRDEDIKIKLEEEMARQSDYIQIIKYSVICIYRIRKTVFHEAPPMSDIDKHCKNAKRLLSIITMHCLKNFVDYKG